MNQTIYFRKEVWKDFEQEQDKSKLVNELLEKHYSSHVEAPRTHETKKDESILIEGTTIAPKLCKHNSHPKYCKYAKNGKLCK